MTNHLMSNSKSYYEESDIYQLFSQAEDAPCKIFDFLEPHINIEDNIFLDLGCGNGKYAEQFLKTKTTYAIDLSAEQLSHITNTHINKIRANASHIPLADNSIDVVLCAWVLGTINDEQQAKEVIQEIKRVLKPQGHCFLIENDIGSEFEALRGRYPDISRTQNYNQWLINHGFIIATKIDTYFQFQTDKIAQAVFSHIWKDRLTQNVFRSKIDHKVIVFQANKEQL